MVRFSFLALGLLVTPSVAHQGHHPHQHPHPPHMYKHHMHEHHHVEHPALARALQNVEQTCARDVSTLCSVRPIQSDPFLDFLFRPPSSSMSMLPPSRLVIDHDFDEIMQHMMSSALSFHQQMNSEEHQPIRLIFSSHSVEPPLRPPQPDEEVFDSMLFRFADAFMAPMLVADEAKAQEAAVVEEPADEEQPPEEAPVEEAPPAAEPLTADPIEFSKRLINYGAEVLEREQDEDRRRLARRLTQVQPDMLTVHRPPSYRLPFGCPQNRCLVRAYEQGAVSTACAQSLEHLQVVSKMDATQEKLFVGMAFLYFVLCLVTLYMLHRRFRKNGKLGLKRRIMQAVYKNPLIKAAIEEDLQEDLGHSLPVPHHMSGVGGGNPFFKCIKLVTLFIVLVLAIVNPFLAMPVMCIVLAVRLAHLCCCAPVESDSNGDCSCCCCGLSTNDVHDGYISAEQACCSCCQGSGVCAPACADCSCCQSGCCCGDMDCDCCKGEAEDTRPVKMAENKIYTGIPVQVV